MTSTSSCLVSSKIPNVNPGHSFFYKGGHSFSMKLPLIPFQFTAVKCQSSLEFAPFYCNFIHIYRTNPSKHQLLAVLKATAMLLEKPLWLPNVQGGFLKRFRTRNTEVVCLVDLLDEAKNRSKVALIEQGKGEEWTEEEIESTADAVGYGAVKYADLKNNKLTNYTLNFDQMLNDKKVICKEPQESKIPPSLLFSDKF
ncbi:hypothetical protein GOBAR_DD17718 [Gossypium barbadense]|nr:hypothetical protein GOBAR_DD17718 [Gossypium barbadense]